MAPDDSVSGLWRAGVHLLESLKANAASTEGPSNEASLDKESLSDLRLTLTNAATTGAKRKALVDLLSIGGVRVWVIDNVHRADKHLARQIVKVVETMWQREALRDTGSRTKVVIAWDRSEAHPSLLRCIDRLASRSSSVSVDVGPLKTRKTRELIDRVLTQSSDDGWALSSFNQRFGAMFSAAIESSGDSRAPFGGDLAAIQLWARLWCMYSGKNDEQDDHHIHTLSSFFSDSITASSSSHSDSSAQRWTIQLLRTLNGWWKNESKAASSSLFLSLASSKLPMSSSFARRYFGNDALEDLIRLRLIDVDTDSADVDERLHLPDAIRECIEQAGLVSQQLHASIAELMVSTISGGLATLLVSCERIEWSFVPEQWQFNIQFGGGSAHADISELLKEQNPAFNVPHFVVLLVRPY